MPWIWNRQPQNPARRSREKRMHGCDVFEDLKFRIPALQIRMIFDVGANVGQSSLEFRRRFPSAEILSFEPVPSTFEQLRKNLGSAANIRAFPIAFGADQGQAHVVIQKKSVNNSLRQTVAEPVPSGAAFETVEIDTLDAFCARERIAQIDFLKIDTEGWDLEVLRGGNVLLSEHRVMCLQAEVGMNPFNHKHVPLHEIQEHLESRGYVLFGLYDQTPEWNGAARLQFCNAVFILAELAEGTNARRRPAARP